MTTTTDRAPLRRALGTGLLTLFVVGDVLGAGIYTLVGEAAGRAGGALWLALAVALVLALLTAGSYAELVTPASPRRAARPCSPGGRSAASSWRSWSDSAGSPPV